jgi:hypothetical protein
VALLRVVPESRPTFSDDRMAVLVFDQFTLILDAAATDSTATIGFNSADCDADFAAMVATRFAVAPDGRVPCTQLHLIRSRRAALAFNGILCPLSDRRADAHAASRWRWPTPPELASTTWVVLCRQRRASTENRCAHVQAHAAPLKPLCVASAIKPVGSGRFAGHDRRSQTGRTSWSLDSSAATAQPTSGRSR